MTREELEKEKRYLELTGNLYPMGLVPPNWKNIERYKEINKLLEELKEDK